MDNEYYIPNDPVVKNIIYSIWQVNRVTGSIQEYIIPKGVIEIIFDFSDCSPFIAQINNSHYRLPRCFINGFNTSPIQMQLQKEQVFLGVLFQPLAIKKIFGIHNYEFSNIPLDLTLLDPSFHSIWHQLADQVNFNNRVKVLLNWAKRHTIEWNPQEQFINQFLYASHQHDLSVRVLAGSLNYSTRHLSRKIFEVTGMNTEEILAYKKYLHAVHLIHYTHLPLTAIAYQSQYADQSHFIKSFKQYTKMTPGEYRRNKSGIKGHLYTDVR